MEFGKGAEFRRPGWLERAGRPLRKPLANSPLKAPLKRVYDAVLDALPGDRLVSRFPHGEAVRLTAAYRQVVWNPEEYEAFRKVVKTGATALDIGANLGAYTVLLAQWVGSGGRVHAFEPAPGARAGLVRHVDLNGFGDRVVVHAEALSAGSGRGRFRAVGIQGDNRLISGGAEDGIEVGTISIDDFCLAHDLRPGFVKVDVEGAELGVLAGAGQTLASRPVLLVEVGDATAQPVAERLAALGYEPYEVRRDGARRGLDGARGFFNALFVPPERWTR
jgi:FkbM family methyltransferase